jgi:hypothetical protein
MVDPGQGKRQKPANGRSRPTVVRAKLAIPKPTFREFSNLALDDSKLRRPSDGSRAPFGGATEARAVTVPR